MFISTIIFLATSDKRSYRNNGDSGGTFSDRGDIANDDEDSISVGVDAS